MDCKKCNSDIPDNSIFCLFCGFDQRKTIKTKKSKTRGNGTGTAYKRGKYWEAQYTHGKKKSPESGKLIANRKRKSGFLTKKEALEYIPKLAAAGTAKKAVSTVATLWENYSENAMLKLSKSQQVAYKTAFNKIKNYKEIDIYNSPINELTIDMLQTMVNAVAPTFRPARDIKNLLSQFYKRAVAQQEVAASLAPFIELPENNEESPEPFNEDDLKKIWERYGCGDKFAAYILLMIYTGMMPGELFIVKKDMIDWEKQQIIGCGLKTKKRKETPMVVADFMLPVLEEICLNNKKEKLLAMNEDNFYCKFHETLKECEIKDRKPYACRHTTATALALGNIAPDVIQQIMRHTKFDTTKRYIHKEIDTSPMLEAINTLTRK